MRHAPRFLSTVLILSLSAQPITVAEELRKPESKSRATVMLSVSISPEKRTQNDQSKLYQMLVNVGGGPGVVWAGWRFPVPSTTFKDSAANTPVTAYSYESVGTRITALVRRVGEDYLLELQIEDSAIVQQGGPTSRAELTPVIRVSSLNISTTMRDGESQTAGQIAHPGGGVSFVDVTLNAR
jgi:hypothetical protein